MNEQFRDITECNKGGVDGITLPSGGISPACNILQNSRNRLSHDNLEIFFGRRI